MIDINRFLAKKLQKNHRNFISCNEYSCKHFRHIIDISEMFSQTKALEYDFNRAEKLKKNQFYS